MQTALLAENHPARMMALAHRSELRRRPGGLTKAMGATKSAVLADPMVLLIGGAHENGQIGKPGPTSPCHRRCWIRG